MRLDVSARSPTPCAGVFLLLLTGRRSWSREDYAEWLAGTLAAVLLPPGEAGSA